MSGWSSAGSDSHNKVPSHAYSCLVYVFPQYIIESNSGSSNGISRHSGCRIFKKKIIWFNLSCNDVIGDFFSCATSSSWLFIKCCIQQVIRTSSYVWSLQLFFEYPRNCVNHLLVMQVYNSWLHYLQECFPMPGTFELRQLLEQVLMCFNFVNDNLVIGTNQVTQVDD